MDNIDPWVRNEFEYLVAECKTVEETMPVDTDQSLRCQLADLSFRIDSLERLLSGVLLL